MHVLEQYRAYLGDTTSYQPSNVQGGDTKLVLSGEGGTKLMLSGGGGGIQD